MSSPKNVFERISLYVTEARMHGGQRMEFICGLTAADRKNLWDLIGPPDRKNTVKVDGITAIFLYGHHVYLIDAEKSFIAIMDQPQVL